MPLPSDGKNAQGCGGDGSLLASTSGYRAAVRRNRRLRAADQAIIWKETGLGSKKEAETEADPNA